MFEFFQNFDSLGGIFTIANYGFRIIGISLIIYTFLIFCITAFVILRLKTDNPFQIIHIVSVIDVYTFICFLLGVACVANIFGILSIKIALFGIIVLFNGITATRLFAKTAYFYSMRAKKLT
jgi:hypothetical protein